MLFCAKCENRIPESAKFCTSCGTPIDQLANPIQTKDAYSKNSNRNYKWVIVGAIVLLAVVAGYFILFNPNNLKSNQNTLVNIDSGLAENPSNLNIDSKTVNINYSPVNRFANKKIPQPLVPIVRASDVLPSWNENEDIDGDHLLIGFYLGAIGKKPVKLFITGVDTINNYVIGNSIVGSNNVNFEGTFTKRYRKSTTNQASNMIDVDSWIYNLILFEPEMITTNGVFQLEFEINDLSGSSGIGSWVSYNGKLYRELNLINTIIASNQ